MNKVYLIIALFLSVNLHSGVMLSSGFSDSVNPGGLSQDQQNLLNALNQTPPILFAQPAGNIQSELSKVGITISSQLAAQLMNDFNTLIMVRVTGNGDGYMIYPSMVAFNTFKGYFPYLSDGQARQLYQALQDEFSTNDLDATDRLFAALFLEAFGIQFFEQMIEQQAKALVLPSQPTSPTIVLSKNLTAGVTSNLARRYSFGLATGEFTLDNLFVAADYSYTEYDFTDTNDTGHIHYKSLTLGGDFSEQFSFSFSFFHDQVDQRGPNDLLSNQLGMSLALTCNINENYGLSVLGFYSEADIEEINSNTFTYGGGLLFSSYHRFGDFEVSTSNTIVRSVTDFGNDLLWLANLRLGYHWTDEFSTGIYGYYIDSMDEDVDIDSSYTMLGGDMTYRFTDQIAVTLGFETVQHLKNYKSETYFVSFLYRF